MMRRDTSTRDSANARSSRGWSLLLLDIRFRPNDLAILSSEIVVWGFGVAVDGQLAVKELLAIMAEVFSCCGVFHDE